MDVGDILGIEKYKIDKNDNTELLMEKLSEIGSILLINVLDKPLNPQPQDSEGVSYCKKVVKKDAEINWKEKTAFEIDCQVRAYVNWPVTYTFYKKKRLKIISGQIFDNDLKGHEEGVVLDLERNRVGVQCKKGVMELLTIQEEGKKPMEVHNFLKGHRDFVGTLLG